MCTSKMDLFVKAIGLSCMTAYDGYEYEAFRFVHYNFKHISQVNTSVFHACCCSHCFVRVIRRTTQPIYTDSVRACCLFFNRDAG